MNKGKAVSKTWSCQMKTKSGNTITGFRVKNPAKRLISSFQKLLKMRTPKINGKARGIPHKLNRIKMPDTISGSINNFSWLLSGFPGPSWRSGPGKPQMLYFQATCWFRYVTSWLLNRRPYSISGVFKNNTNRKSCYTLPAKAS